jgi:6,7-dimethyl-8-ribityllumazine synthase
MITRHSPLYGGSNYRVLTLHLVHESSVAVLAATLDELKSRGVSVDETVVMDVSNLNVLPTLLSGAIKTKAYDCFVVIGIAAQDATHLPLIETQAILVKLIDIAALRATPLGVGISSPTSTLEQTVQLARRAVLDALETANSIDTVNEF